jgi:Peptidase family M23
MVPTGTAEYTVTDGTIVTVAGTNEYGWNTLGGYTMMLRAAYSVGPVKHGDLFYYAHLDRKSALEIGTRVRVGQTIGYAGSTGEGPKVTRGEFASHLHFGWYDATGTRSTATSGAMNPYSLLERIKAHGGAIAGGSDARYCEAPRTGGPVLSAGASRWPAPASPGVSPDLDSGSNGPYAGSREPQIDRPSGAAPQTSNTHHRPRARATHPEKPRRGPIPRPPDDHPPGTRARQSSATSLPPAMARPIDEPAQAPAGGSYQDHPAAPAPNPDANKTTDHPGEEQNPDEHAQKGSGGGRT